MLYINETMFVLEMLYEQEMSFDKSMYLSDSEAFHM